METKRKNEFLVTLKALDEACETLVMENDRNLQIIEMLQMQGAPTVSKLFTLAHCEDKYKSQKIIPANDSKPTGHPICVFETY